MGRNQKVGSEAWKFFLAGVFEGEGSIAVSVKKAPWTRFGYVVDPEVFVYQHREARYLLEQFKLLFGSGRISPKPGNEVILVYCLTARRTIAEKVIPFLKEYVYPFSAKKDKILLFEEIVSRLQRKEHLSKEGMIRLIELAYQMTSSKGKGRLREKETVLEEILRDHTPEAGAT